jgi:ATP-dependent helicase HrpA
LTLAAAEPPKNSLIPTNPITPAARQAAAVGLSLPIYEFESQILDAVRDHQVVIIEGPTGCGKTTQLPRMLLRSGLSATCIGITQPRRIAAVSVARRIAEEAGVTLGAEVGYAIRFEDETSSRTILKLMTDGILLQEARSDALFSRYDVLIVDEAHERSLNIDLVMGLLNRALQVRKDLRVIISSATLQPERFQAFFSNIEAKPPLLSVTARTFPVEIQYTPPKASGDSGLSDAVGDHVAAIHRGGAPGHILVFLTGEGMIKASEEAIQTRLGSRPDLMVLTLFGRMTRTEQDQVFEEFPGKRKVILSTNIAETSITIPDVRFVIDCGMAKIPRFKAGLGWTSLREEPISRASTEQRAGRAGRTAPGRVIRLYTQDSVKKRPEFTDEEILRLDLSEVMLRLIDLGITDIERFHFPTRPSDSKIIGALNMLRGLGAIDGQRALTEAGRHMVKYPLSPRLSRMVVEALLHQPNVLDEALILAATLSTRGPFTFPAGMEDEARRAHRDLAHPLGDITTAVKVFREWERSGNRKTFCAKNFLDPDIMEFIARARRQLIDIASNDGTTPVLSGGEPDQLLLCVAIAYPDMILRSVGARVFEAGNGETIALHPSSALYGAKAKLVVATEIMEIKRIYAFQATAITAEIVAAANPGLVDQWQLRVNKKKEVKAIEAATPIEIPSELKIGTFSLPVTTKGKKVSVAIPIHVARQIETVALDTLPAGALEWRASVVSRHGLLAHNTPLGKLLCLLPFMPLPDDDSDLTNTVPEGALLDLDRNMHTIERHLDRVLSPMYPSRGPHPGWLMIVSNGAESFWFEVSSDYQEALEVSAAAISDLLEALPTHETDLIARLRPLSESLDRRVEQVLDSTQRLRRKRR